MRVSTVKIETPIELNSNSPIVLIEENPREFYNVVGDFLKAFDGEESEFSFWDGDKSIEPSKCGEMLNNLFTFEFADKKIVNLLYKTLQNNFLDGEFLVQFSAINTEIAIFLEKLSATVDFSLDYDELSLENLFKSCSLKPSKTYDSLLEKIICYINIFVSLKNISFFVFVDLKSVLSKEELCTLYQHCELQQVSLLLIESTQNRNKVPTERTIIITDDLCELTEGFVE